MTKLEPGRAAWLLWWAFTVAWTTLLVIHVPSPEIPGASREVREQLMFLVAKTLHVVIYAVWTIGSGWLRPAFSTRLLLLLFLLGHGVASEFIQSHLEHRSGTLRDALLDNLGVLLGLLAAWRWWTTPPRG